MEATAIQQIAAGTPGVMIVVNAADLKTAVAAMCREHQEQTAKAIAAHRERPTMSRAQVMETLGVSASTLWQWGKSGYLAPVKIGTKVMYRPTDIDRILQAKQAKTQNV